MQFLKELSAIRVGGNPLEVPFFDDAEEGGFDLVEEEDFDLAAYLEPERPKKKLRSGMELNLDFFFWKIASKSQKIARKIAAAKNNYCQQFPIVANNCYCQFLSSTPLKGGCLDPPFKGCHKGSVPFPVQTDSISWSSS